MGKNSMPQNAILLAWATPVNLVQLGARLEAYAETKAGITTFRIAARHSTLAPFHKLPEEILSMIASEVREIAFNGNLKFWTRVRECLSNDCSKLDHARSVSRRYIGSSSLSDDEVYEKFKFEAADEHQRHVERYCQSLSNLDGRSSRFAKCVKVFTRDSGIRPYFLLHESFDYDLYSETLATDHINTHYVRAQAFLTLPLPLGSISSNPGPHLTCFSIYETMDPSTLQRFCQSPLQRFKLATKMLNIQPNTGGNERRYKQEPYENHETWSELSSFQLKRLYRTLSSDESRDSGISESRIDENYDDHDDNHKSDRATSHETPSKAPLPPGTANAGAETKRNLSHEDGSAAKKINSPDPNTNGADVWPKLMILGCGQFAGWERGTWYS